jgi:hypothetical protein
LVACVGCGGRIWNQPHAIFLAELEYRAASTDAERRQVLDRYADVVRASAVRKTKKHPAFCCARFKPSDGNRSFYQDRLGTNAGKVWGNKELWFLRAGFYG